MKANTLGWPTEVFDMIALVSAFTTATALSPLIAYGYADLEEADLRWCSTETPPITNATECGVPVSSSIATLSALSATMSFLSVLCAVTVRGALAFEPFYASPVVSQVLQRLLTPIVVFAVGPMVAAALMCPACPGRECEQRGMLCRFQHAVGRRRGPPARGLAHEGDAVVALGRRDFADRFLNHALHTRHAGHGADVGLGDPSLLKLYAQGPEGGLRLREDADARSISI